MIKVLSWILVFCIALYFLGIMGLVFISPSLIPNMIAAVMAVAILSGGLLLILLIRERIKDKEAEKNDLDKY